MCNKYNMIYAIVTTSIIKDCEIRQKQYLFAIDKFIKIMSKNFSEYKVIIVENNGLTESYLNHFNNIENCQIFYTKNNFLNTKNKGFKELKDIHDCINNFHINDNDFIIKITGRYIINNDSDFIKQSKLIKKSNIECIIKYGSYLTPSNYDPNDCITGLIGMKCEYIKNIEYPNENECVEWKWAKITKIINNNKICKLNYLGIKICPGTNTYFDV